MRRFALGLLVMLCLCCPEAWAEITTVTEGQLTYTVKQGKWEKYVNVTGYNLPEGQNYVYIPETWRGMPVYAKGESIPEQVEVVYIPWKRGAIAPVDGRSLMNALYVSAADAGEYKDEFHLADLRESDLVLLDVWDCRVENDQWVEHGGYLKREETPAELDGHRLNTTSSAVIICQTKGECIYYRSPNNGSPTIMGAELPEDATELMIPAGLEGNAYCYINSAALGDEIHTIYVPYEYSCSGVYITDGTRQDSAAYCLIEYADYETVMATPELKSKFGHMGEDDYALVEAKLRYVNFASENQQEQVIAFDADSLPTELRGHKLHISRMLSHKSRVRDDYQKALRGEFDTWMRLINTDVADVKTDSRTFFEPEDATGSYKGMLYAVDEAYGEVQIVDFDFPEGQTELFIPAQIDGCKVRDIRFGLIPEQIKKVWKHEESGLSMVNKDYPANRKLTVYEYSVGNVDCVTLERAVRYLWDENRELTASEPMAQVDTLPETVNGCRVKVAYHPWFIYEEQGWEYYLAQGENNKVQACIVGCNIPEGVKELSVPEELGGCRVSYIDMAAIPQSVQTISIPRDCYMFTEQENRPNLKIVEKNK